MGLDTAIEHRIELSTDIEHKSLYKWCLREFSDDGKQIGRDWIPWGWRLDFRAKKCTYHLSFTDDRNDETDAKKVQIEASEYITADLVPEERRARAPQYFMMGSSRVVEDISLIIRKSDASAHCHCFAMPEYEGGIEFHEETIPDQLQFTIFLEAEKFDQIVQLIKAGSLGNLIFSASLVAGFYSDWSPDIVTNTIKILSSPEDHKLAISDKLKDKLPRTGRVGEYSLYLTSNENTVKIKNGEEDFIDDIYGEEKDDLRQNSGIRKPIDNDKFVKLETKIKQLKLPLWIAVGLLAALLLK